MMLCRRGSFRTIRGNADLICRVGALLINGPRDVCVDLQCT